MILVEKNSYKNNKSLDNTNNIIKFKKPRLSREQRRKIWIRIIAVIGVILTLGGIVISCLYSIL